MGVWIQPKAGVIGFYQQCAFDDTVYATKTMTGHPATGGCEAAIAFNALAMAEGYAAACERFGRPVNEHRTYDPGRCMQWRETYEAWGIEYEDVPVVQMSLSNAQDILRVLGMDWSGSMSGQEMRERVLVARGLNDQNQAKPGSVSVGERGATLIVVGREANYVETRLAQLGEMAEWAILHNVDITWS